MTDARRTWRLFAALAAGVAAIGLARYASWHSHTLDMAYYVRLVWGLGHGEPALTVVGAPHWLGLHMEPILFVFAGLGRLGLPVAETLLVAQALAGSAVIFPARALAARHLPEGARGAALAVFLVPAFAGALDYDFHPVTMAVWPLLALIDAVERGRARAAAAWALLALACREDVGLVVAAAMCVARELPAAWRVGLGTFGVAWFGLHVGVIQPAFAFAHELDSYVQHFGALGVRPGGGVRGVIEAVLADPLRAIAHLATWDRLLYLPLLLLSFALLPLAAPRWLAGAAPLLAINLLSGYPTVRTLDTHYLTAAVPFLFAAGLQGAARLGHPRLLLAACGLSCVLSLDPWLGARARGWFPDADTGRARAAAAQVPPDAAVVAPSEVLAHLAERPFVYHPRFAPARPLWRVGSDGAVDLVQSPD